MTKSEIMRKGTAHPGACNTCEAEEKSHSPMELLMHVLGCLYKTLVIVFYGFITILFLAKIGTLLVVSDEVMNFAEFPTRCSDWAKD